MRSMEAHINTMFAPDQLVGLLEVAEEVVITDLLHVSDSEVVHFPMGREHS